jgi:hypothetical protein
MTYALISGIQPPSQTLPKSGNFSYGWWRWSARLTPFMLQVEHSASHGVGK